MTVKASGRWALILTTGLFVCFAGALRAAESADDAATVATEGAADAPIALNKYAKHGSRHLKTYAHHKSGNVALKSANDNKATTADDGASSAAIPPSVANANAQLTPSDTKTGNASAMSIRANDIEVK